MSKEIQLPFLKTDTRKPLLAIIFLSFVLYSNTLNHFFVLDDGMVITNHNFTQQGIQGIPDLFKYDTFMGFWLNLYEGSTIEQLKENMSVVEGGRYRPLSLATFALEVELFGKKNVFPDTKIQFMGNAFVSHLINILLYLFTTCLLFILLRRLFPPGKDSKWYLSFPFIASLLFLAHPIHTEVVANIKSRDEIMALLGSLAALWFTIRYFDTNKSYHLGLSGLCLFLGLLSKENAITFLAIIPLTIYYFVGKDKMKIGKSLLPLILVSAVFLIIRARVIGSVDTTYIRPEILNNPFAFATTSETLATASYTLLLYVRLLLFPHPLTYDYYPYHIEITNWSNPVVLLSLFFYLGIGIYAVYGMYKKSDVFSWAIWLYLLPLSVVANIFFPIGVFMGERFIFFSSIGFAICVGWLLYYYIPKLMPKSPYSAYLTGALLVVILCLYSGKTISRNMAWADDFTLFTTDVKTSKNSAKANYLASIQYIQKTISPDSDDDDDTRKEYCDEAVRLLTQAVQLYPQYTDALTMLGELYIDFYRDMAKSLHYYTMVLPIETTTADVVMDYIKNLLQMTSTLLDENQVSSTPEEIIQACDDLLKIRPNTGEAYYVKGLIYGKYLNRVADAMVNFKRALSIDFPKTAKFYEEAGTVYGLYGDPPTALHYLLMAEEMGSENYTTYLNIGMIYQWLGDIKNADLYTARGNEMLNQLSKNEK
jgi:4-amino-4-deoxy-L-arabinose transferase and related glycosyltransferases of PMT family